MVQEISDIYDPEQHIDCYVISLVGSSTPVGVKTTATQSSESTLSLSLSLSLMTLEGCFNDAKKGHHKKHTKRQVNYRTDWPVSSVLLLVAYFPRFGAFFGGKGGSEGFLTEGKGEPARGENPGQEKLLACQLGKSERCMARPRRPRHSPLTNTQALATAGPKTESRKRQERT